MVDFSYGKAYDLAMQATISNSTRLCPKNAKIKPIFFFHSFQYSVYCGEKQEQKIKYVKYFLTKISDNSKEGQEIMYKKEIFIYTTGKYLYKFNKTTQKTAKQRFRLLIYYIMQLVFFFNTATLFCLSLSPLNGAAVKYFQHTFQTCADYIN